MKKSLFPLLYTALSFLNRIAFMVSAIWMLMLISTFVLILSKAGLSLAVLFGITGVVITYQIFRFWQWGWREAELYHYANITKWIVVTSDSPEDTTAFKRAQYDRKMLLESNNQFGVEVFEVIFDPNCETWEEYSAPAIGRRDSETRDIMLKWRTFMMSELNKTGASEEDRKLFYYQMHLNQEV